MDLLTYKTKQRRQLIRRATSWGATSIAFLAHAVTPAKVPGAVLANFSPFVGGDMSKVRSAYWKWLDDTVEMINDGGAVAMVYGLVFPDIRRGFAFEGFKYKGQTIPLDDWESYDGLAKIAWEDFWAKVNKRLGHNKNKVVYVDGVEPYTSRLSSPPNVYTASIASITPWAYKAYAGGEIHANPGDPAPRSPEPVLVYDGWGDCDRVWTVDDDGERRKLVFAGLPRITGVRPGRKYDDAAATKVAKWFRAEYRIQKEYRDYFLWLHTPGWGAYDFASAKNPELQRDGVLGYPEPFEKILKMLRREARRTVDEVQPVGSIPEDAFDLKQARVLPNNADTSGWEVTSEVVVTIKDSVIEVPHTMSGTWPEIAEGYGNPWVVFRHDGVWYAGTWEWLKNSGGGTTKYVTDDNIGGHLKFGVGPSWHPSPGERCYMFVAGLSRLGARNVSERSNLVKVIWPY